MGCCSAGNVTDCHSIDDLVYLTEHYKKLATQEKEELDKYLTDKTPLKNFKLNDYDGENGMKQRSDYLSEYINATEKAVKTMSQNNRMDFEQTKLQIDPLIKSYQLKEDEKGVLNTINDNLEKLLNAANGNF
jgi:hypothetical protein